MILLKCRFFTIPLLYLIIIYAAGCGFDNPYVPETAGSSTLTGRITPDSAMDLTGTKVLLQGQDSFATTTGANGEFHFKNIPPGGYSLQIQKAPYLLSSFPVNIRKATDENLGNVDVRLAGAIAGTIPDDKIAIVHGEVEVVVYVDGVPFMPQHGGTSDFVVELSSTESKISVRAETKIIVYIENVPYYATVQDRGSFIVEFVPPGIYNDIKVKVDSEEAAISLVSEGPIEVKSGQTRFLSPMP